jgi:branched-chain amino acid transport system substrate-binding protein
MKARRGYRVAAAVCAAAVATFGLGVGAVSAQQIDKQVRNIKKVKPPKDCPDIQGVNDGEIKIGSITPLTGPNSGSGFFPNIIQGVEARFEAANAADELDGRELTLVSLDDKGDTAQNLSAAQSLVEQEKVYAVIPMSAAGPASAPYLNQKGIPAVGWQLGLDIYGKYPNFFGFQNANSANLAQNYTSRNAQSMSAAGAKKVALIGGNTGNAAVFLKQVEDSIGRFGKKLGGVEVVYFNSDVPVGNTDWGSYAEEIKNSGADTMYTALATTDNIALVNALKQANAPVENILLSAGYDPRVAALPAFEGAYLGIEFKPLETTPEPEGIAAFKAAMAQYRPDAVVNQSAAVGWLTANTLIEGIKAAGVECPTWEGFVNNLRLTKGYTADGWFEPINFQEVFNKPFACAYYVQIVGGKFTPAFDGEPVCGQFVKNNKIQPATPATTPPTTAAAG